MVSRIRELHKLENVSNIIQLFVVAKLPNQSDMACHLDYTWLMSYWFHIWIPHGMRMGISQSHMSDIYIWYRVVTNFFCNFPKIFGKNFKIKCYFPEELQMWEYVQVRFSCWTLLKC